MADTEQMIESPFKWVIPGVAALFIILALIIGVGFYAAYLTEGEGTLESAAAVFIYPAPYVVYALVGTILVHNRRSRIMATSFNIGAIILLAVWIFMVFYVGTPTDMRENYQLVSILVHNVIVGGIVSAILLLVLFLENMLLWPGK